MSVIPAQAGIHNCLKTNESIVINAGYFSIDSGDDGIHADLTLEINDGELNILKLMKALKVQPSRSMGVHSGLFPVMTVSMLQEVLMAQTPDQSSSQHALLVNLDTTQPAGSLIHIEIPTGENIVTFAPSNSYQSRE